MTQSKGHPHAALMLEYAKDAAEHAEPWLLWEMCSTENDNWMSCSGYSRGPTWNPKLRYRRKPRTIRIGKIKVPKPLRSAPQEGVRVYVANLCEPSGAFSFYWKSDRPDDLRLLKAGLVHLDLEAAEAHARALIAVSGGEV